ncbi:MAG: hydrogenase formation protein HypD [Rhodospirillales bacterium]|nr:hydrogenase formation protein HypD [Rhodospirillales bacterium]
MRYVDEFRDGRLAQSLRAAIHAEAQADRVYHLMEFCGGHTHAIFRYGVLDLLPDTVQMIHGPGCPVCVLPIERIDHALQLALEHDVTLCTYGDLLRVPGREQQSLLKAKAAGADVRMVYSCLDAIALAEANPSRQVVFFAIGFETTTPPTAVAILTAATKRLKNFTVHCNHVLTPPAVAALLDSVEAAKSGRLPLDGFVGPAHVSAVIGSDPFEPFARDYGRPVVIAGFEPLDVMQAVLMLIRQLNAGESRVEIEYTRVVAPEGNRRAQALVDKVFELRPQFPWRGLGDLPESALAIRPEYAAFDAEQRFPMRLVAAEDHKACLCPNVLRGMAKPTDCKLFATVCTPENPIGSCMVSSEGACAAYFTFGRSRRLSPQRVAS